MKNLRDLITWRSRHQAAQAHIFELSRNHRWVEVEIESTPLRFWSKVTFRAEAVVLNSHLEHEPYLKKGAWVRLRPDPEQPEEIRLRIQSLRYGGSGAMATAVGRMALLCNLGRAETVRAYRAHPRYFTGTHPDAHLELPPDNAAFPLLDISMTGLRVRLVDRKAFSRFPLRLPQRHTALQLAPRKVLHPEIIIPRHHHPHSVGFEMHLEPGSEAVELLENFLAHLRYEERHPES